MRADELLKCWRHFCWWITTEVSTYGFIHILYSDETERNELPDIRVSPSVCHIMGVNLKPQPVLSIFFWMQNATILIRTPPKWLQASGGRLVGSILDSLKLKYEIEKYFPTNTYNAQKSLKMKCWIEQNPLSNQSNTNIRAKISQQNWNYFYSD